MSTKHDPGAYDCYAKLADDEPYFVLRGRDRTAPLIVRQWVAARVYEAFISQIGISPAYARKLREALECAYDMEQWQAAQEKGEKKGKKA